MSAARNMRMQITEKRFPPVAAAPAKLVFQRFDACFAHGEVCAILGPSGVGKSTLLNIAAGIDRGYQGEVTDSPHPVGYLFQSPRLLPWLTACQNLDIVLHERRALALHWLERVGLAAAADVYPDRLSLGMARRVALARALAVEPRLLLLDEPFTALDADTAGMMRELLERELASRPVTTLLVTHDAGDAAHLAQRMIVLSGSPARVISDTAAVRA